MRNIGSTLLAAASVYSLAAACGDDDPHRHLDAGRDSPLSDTPLIDAAAAPVTLTVTRNGAPQANVKVYFLAADSSVIANTTTDATGVAGAIMPAGGSVTAIDPFALPPAAGNYQLYTFLGAKPGDHLKLSQGAGTQTDIVVDAAADTDPSVASYEAATPCQTTSYQGSGAPSFALSLDPACATTTDFLLTSRDSGNNLLHSAFIKDKAISATVDLTAATATWSNLTTKTYEIDNTDIFNNEISVIQHLSSSKGELIKLDPAMTSQGLPYTYSLAAPSFQNEGSIVETTGYAGGYAEHHILEWGPFTSAKYTLDAGAAAVVDITAAPSIDTSAHAITWTEAATGVTPEFVVGVAFAFRTASDTGWEWNIAGPHTGASLAFPTLPTDVSDFTITSDDSSSADLLALAKAPGGYDAARAHVFGDMSELITTPTGTFVGAGYIGQGPLRPLPPRKMWASRLASVKATPLSVAPIKTRLTGRRR